MAAERNQIPWALWSSQGLPGCGGLDWPLLSPSDMDKQSLWLRGLVTPVPWLQMRFSVWPSIPALCKARPASGSPCWASCRVLAAVCTQQRPGDPASARPPTVLLLTRSHHIPCGVTNGLFKQTFECLLCTHRCYFVYPQSKTPRSILNARCVCANLVHSALIFFSFLKFYGPLFSERNMWKVKRAAHFTKNLRKNSLWQMYKSGNVTGKEMILKK